MENILEQFLLTAKMTKNVNELNDLLHKTINAMGFDQWAYQFKKDKTTPFVVGEFPNEWVDHYLDSNYSEIDPVVIHGEKEVIPFQWSKLAEQHSLTANQNKFMNEASEFGLIDGVGVPIHYTSGKSALLTMVSQEEKPKLIKTFKHFQNEIHLITLIYHQHLQDLMEQESFINVTLTSREQEVLKWAAMGKTSWETSEILNIAERTVNFHIENSRKKLHASSKQHAVIVAIMNKLIEN